MRRFVNVVAPDAMDGPEGNETSRGSLPHYYLMLQYVGALARRCGDERELERWRAFLNAA